MMMMPAVTRHWDFRIKEISPRPMFFFPAFKNALLFHCRKICSVSPCSMNTGLNTRNSILSLIHHSVLPSHLCFKLYVNSLSQKECHYFISKSYIIHNELNAIALIIKQ